MTYGLNLMIPTLLGPVLIMEEVICENPDLSSNNGNMWHLGLLSNDSPSTEHDYGGTILTSRKRTQAPVLFHSCP